MSAQPTEEQKLAFRVAFEQGGIPAANEFARSSGVRFSCPKCKGIGSYLDWIQDTCSGVECDICEACGSFPTFYVGKR